MKRIIKNEKGITLIALVVTIVVMLILATVSIAMLLGRDSLVENAGKAKEDTETAEDDVVFDTAYTIKHANTLTWSKPGYEFVGWANSKENADLGNVVYSYVDTNDLPFYAYTYDYDTELWAVWTATDNDYTIEYYFERTNRCGWSNNSLKLSIFDGCLKISTSISCWLYSCY